MLSLNANEVSFDDILFNGVVEVKSFVMILEITFQLFLSP